jgi:hypothetical protein
MWFESQSTEGEVEMALKLNINKASGADRVTLSPAPLKIVLSKEQPAASTELVVTASEDFKQRPGPNKTVTFRFLNDESRSLFDTPAKPEPFVLKPGESLSLKLKNSSGISKRPASGSSSQQFERTAAEQLTSDLPERSALNLSNRRRRTTRTIPTSTSSADPSVLT